MNAQGRTPIAVAIRPWLTLCATVGIVAARGGGQNLAAALLAATGMALYLTTTTARMPVVRPAYALARG